MKRHIRFASTGSLRYPWDEMKPGDYFDVPQCARSRNTVQSSACHRSEKHRGERYKVSELFNENRQKVTRVRRVK